MLTGNFLLAWSTASWGELDNAHLRLSGEGRLRWRSVSSTGVEPVGAYGESLEEGQDFRHRLLLEVSAAPAPGLQVEALLRLSDEGELAFHTGPDRLSDERGSVAMRYQGSRLRADLGYYRLHLTPLLLMRWDLEDNPEGGGQSVCACPGEAGALTGESLEEIGPDLLLEGMQVSADLGERLEWTGFWARPQTAVENERFRQLSYGTVLRGFAYHSPSLSFRSLNLALLQHRDDEDSVDRPLSVPYRPARNQIADLSLDFPAGRHLRLKAEGALSRTDGNLLSGTDAEQDGHAALISAELYAFKGMRAQATFLRLSPAFRSQYRALSYDPNRQGFRLTARWENEDERLSGWLFYKRLRSIDPEPADGSVDLEPADERQTFTTLSLGGHRALSGAARLQAIGLYQRDAEANRWSGIGEFTRSLSQRTETTFRYQFVDYDHRRADALDHHTHLISLLSSVAF